MIAKCPITGYVSSAEDPENLIGREVELIRMRERDENIAFSTTEWRNGTARCDSSAELVGNTVIKTDRMGSVGGI